MTMVLCNEQNHRLNNNELQLQIKYFEDVPQFHLCAQCSWFVSINFQPVIPYFKVISNENFLYLVPKQSFLSTLRQWLFTPSNLQMPFSSVIKPKPLELFAQNTSRVFLSV